MAAKKKVAKKKATRKTAVQKKKVVRKIFNAKDISAYFDAKTGELLNPKHEMFCQAWVQTFDNVAACDAAGFKSEGHSAVVNARSLLRKEYIQTRVRNIVAERCTDLQIDENWVVLQMIETYRKCIEDKAVLDADGNVVDYEYKDLRTAMNTIREIGINIGMFQRKDTVTVPALELNLYYGAKQDDPPKLTRQPIEGKSKRLQ